MSDDKYGLTCDGNIPIVFIVIYRKCGARDIVFSVIIDLDFSRYDPDVAEWRKKFKYHTSTQNVLQLNWKERTISQ